MWLAVSIHSSVRMLYPFEKNKLCVIVYFPEEEEEKKKKEIKR